MRSDTLFAAAPPGGSAEQSRAAVNVLGTVRRPAPRSLRISRGGRAAPPGLLNIHNFGWPPAAI
jgi:hypothetical protein